MKKQRKIEGLAIGDEGLYEPYTLCCDVHTIDGRGYIDTGTDILIPGPTEQLSGWGGLDGEAVIYRSCNIIAGVATPGNKAIAIPTSEIERLHLDTHAGRALDVLRVLGE